MPDFEIRYYSADGKLAFIRMCTYPTIADAEIFAQRNIGEYARFEIIDRKAQPGAAT